MVDHLYVFSLDAEAVDGFELLKFDSLTSIVSSQVNDSHEKAVAKSQSSSKNQLECSVCRCDFGQSASREYVVTHYKSDLHRLNLKRALSGLDPLTEAAFEDILERQSLESISGSEESSDNENDEEYRLPTVFEKLTTTDVLNVDNESLVSHMNTKSPFLLLKSPLLPETQAFGAYKALFDSQALSSGAIVEAISAMNTPDSRTGISVLLMIGGGHFAGAVVSHEQTKSKGNLKNHRESMEAQRVIVLDLKTFHRYTTRRKQGGSQSASDNARGKANSAGSSIRRYNEEALKKEVHELLLSWKEHIAKALHIFIRATGTASRKILVGYEGAEIKSSDRRVKSFPFTTNRATLSEVKRAWVKLTHLEPLDLPRAKKSVEKKTPSNAIPLENIPEPAIIPQSDLQTKELIGLLRKSKAPFLINFLRKSGIDSNFRFTPTSQYSSTPTPLHFAASQGLQHMVKVLLGHLKADPTVLNHSGKTPAQLASSELITSTFQVCRHNLGEDYIDWDAAHVGPPKTAEEAAKETEEVKKRSQQESFRVLQEEMAKKTELELKQSSFSSGGRLGGGKVLTQVSDTSGLTEQQKMRFMREQRARAAMARMSANSHS